MLAPVQVLTALEFYETVYRAYHPDMARSYQEQMLCALRAIAQWKRQAATVEAPLFRDQHGTLFQYVADPQQFRVTDFNVPNISRFLRWYREQGRAPRTCNDKLEALMRVWRFAYRKRYCAEKPKRIKKFRVLKHQPRAWRAEEIGRMLAQCQQVQPRRGWTPLHWVALVLVIYDTSLRIGCLMKVPRAAFDVTAGTLTVPAELQKGKVETIQKLHPQTIEVLKQLPPSELLFPWPWSTGGGAVQLRFRREILEPAGLSATRKDCFHKIRRTSYTYTYHLLGPHAASEHAAHSSDLSSNYLDRQLLQELSQQPAPIAVLPRPEF